MVAALKAIDCQENSDDENDTNTDMDTDGDGPLFALFNSLYNAPNASGMFVYILWLTMNVVLTVPLYI